MVLREALPIRVARVLLLEAAGVRQEDLAEVAGRRCTERGSGEPIAYECGQESAVIDVGVGEDDGRERLRLDRERSPVAQSQLFHPLVEATVDQESFPIGLEQVLRARDGARCAQEGQLHGRVSAREALPASTGCPNTVWLRSAYHP
jgi:hypothetical protein